MRETSQRRALGDRLTRREWEVIRTIMAGHTHAEQIAAALVIAPATARSHITSILAKTGALTMAELVLMVVGRKQGTIPFTDIIWE